MKKLLLLLLMLSLAAPAYAETKTDKVNKVLDTLEPVADIGVVAGTYAVDSSWSEHYLVNKGCVRLGSKIPVIKNHPVIWSVTVAGSWIVIKEVILDKSFGTGDAVFDVFGAASAFRFRNKLSKDNKVYIKKEIHQAMVKDYNVKRQELAIQTGDE